jgi:hypothetical protein
MLFIVVPVYLTVLLLLKGMKSAAGSIGFLSQSPRGLHFAPTAARPISEVVMSVTSDTSTSAPPPHRKSTPFQR